MGGGKKGELVLTDTDCKSQSRHTCGLRDDDHGTGLPQTEPVPVCPPLLNFR